MANREVKLAAAGAGVRQWQVAEALGMQDSSLSRKLRRELPEDEKTRMLEIIRELAREQEAAHGNG